MRLVSTAEQVTIVKMKHSASQHALPKNLANEKFPSASAGVITSDATNDSLATLTLGFRHQDGATRLTRREHRGPLRVQKALYPEGSQCCHAVIIHPPGGVVGGDELQIRVRVGENANALISTPGAAKWYRSNGKVSRQLLEIAVSKRASAEWLPQETILFNDADVTLHSHIHLESGARYLGCDILCFGRTASGERFTNGRVRQRMFIHVDDTPVFIEQGTLTGSSAMMNSTPGLSGHTVCASLVGVGSPLGNTTLATLRDLCVPLVSKHEKFGATQMKSVVLIRYLGDSSEVARRVMLAAWQVLRPALLGRESTELRIWNT